MDNGPELNRARDPGLVPDKRRRQRLHRAGSPWENPFVESFGGRVRDEVLGVEAFATLLEAQVVVEDWRIEYNTTRPHSSLGWAGTGRLRRKAAEEADRPPGLS